jgi:hypothetical protein
MADILPFPRERARKPNARLTRAWVDEAFRKERTERWKKRLEFLAKYGSAGAGATFLVLGNVPAAFALGAMSGIMFLAEHYARKRTRDTID